MKRFRLASVLCRQSVHAKPLEYCQSVSARSLFQSLAAIWPSSLDVPSAALQVSHDKLLLISCS